jgi:hypothetical protein
MPLALRSTTPRILDATLREQCIHDLESLINEQLENKRERTLDWAESERLRDYLRVVMPSELFALDEELRSLDGKARSPTETLNPSEKLRFWELWDSWKCAYEKWIEGFPSKGISIRIGSRTKSDPEGLELKREPSWNLEEFSLSDKSPLPSLVKENEKLLELYITAPNRLEADEASDMDDLLRPLWRSTGAQFRGTFRRHLEQYIFGGTTSCLPLDEEVHVLVEAALAHAYGMFVDKLQNTPGARVRIREEVPGSYCLCEDTPIRIDYACKAARVQWAKLNAKVQLKPAHLQPKEDFFIHARLIRHNEMCKIDDEELKKIMTHLILFTLVEIKAVDTIIVRLLAKEQAGGLSDAESEELRGADYQQLWLRWGQMFPELRARVISHSSISDTFWRLDTKRLPGSKPQDVPPTIPPPNPSKIRELEIEINNLITKERNGIISEKQQQELDFLLPELLPPHLRLLKTRIEAFDGDFVSQPGLDFSHSMESNEVKRQFLENLTTWKMKVSSEGGIFVNPWVYSKSQIIQACLRAKEWQDMTRQTDETVSWSATDTTFEDPTVRDLHDMCDTLIYYLESGTYGDVGIEEELLFRFMYSPLAHLFDHIKTQQYELSTRVGDPRDDMTLQFKKQIFITRYIHWLQCLSVRFHCPNKKS